MRLTSNVSMFLESLAVSKCSLLMLLESSLFLLHGLQRILNWDFKLFLLDSIQPEVLRNFPGPFGLGRCVLPSSKDTSQWWCYTW